MQIPLAKSINSILGFTPPRVNIYFFIIIKIMMYEVGEILF